MKCIAEHRQRLKFFIAEIDSRDGKKLRKISAADG